MDLLEALKTGGSGGSGTGVSYYMQRCGAKAYYDRLVAMGGHRSSSFDADVGTVIHKLMELYYAKKLAATVLPVDDQADLSDDAVAEGLRAFSAYIKYFPADEFSVVHNETRFPEIDENGQLTKVGVEQARVLGALLVDPFTFRVDMVVALDSAQCEQFALRRRVNLEPGLYLLDHKTHKQMESHAVRKWSRAPQMIAYPHAYNALVDSGLVAGEKVQGVIINSIIRHQTMSPEATSRRGSSFQTYSFPVAGEMELEAVRQFFRRQKEKLARGEPDLTACEEWGGCPHADTGQCNRVTAMGDPQAIGAK